MTMVNDHGHLQTLSSRATAIPCHLPVTYIDYSRYMDDLRTIDALSALAQPTRIAAFRKLVAAEPEGIAAGELAQQLAVPQNTLSSHLSVLTNAGLAKSQRRSRSIIYRADIAAFRALMLFLLKDCCDGRPEICNPLLAELNPCSIPCE